jgi:hypothetical protein
MPIHPAYKDKEATADLVAALILVAWAEMRLHRDVDKETLKNLWREIKDELQQ